MPTTNSDSQTIATFGTTSVDNGTAATSLHANQKTVRARTANLGWLVSTFHIENPKMQIGSPPARDAVEPTVLSSRTMPE
jgi:hypothetical protein